MRRWCLPFRDSITRRLFGHQSSDAKPPAMKPARNPEQPSKRRATESTDTAAAEGRDRAKPQTWPEEIGGPRGKEPTRYGDWERNGRISDF